MKIFNVIVRFIVRLLGRLKWINIILLARDLVKELPDEVWDIVFQAVAEAETKGNEEGWSGEQKFIYAYEKVKDALKNLDYSTSMIHFLIELAVQVLKIILGKSKAS